MRPTAPKRPWYQRPGPIVLAVCAFVTVSCMILFVVVLVSFALHPTFVGNK
jgi:hypothetical protein